MEDSNPPRRVLGSNKQHESLESPKNPAVGSSEESIRCPICDEAMLTLLQLNRHLDDTHGDRPSSGLEPSPKKAVALRTPQKRTIQLDLYDDNKGFGLSDNLGSETQLASPTQSKLTRSHWVHPNSSNISVCSYEGCRRVLNVKNGIVNCRKCGLLFCNEHTAFRGRFSNGPPPLKLPVYDSVNGYLARCCESCFLNKPALVEGTQANFRDVTAIYKKKRAEKIEEKQWAKLKLQRRFLKLVNLLSLNYLWHIENGKFLLLYFTENKAHSKEAIMDAEKEIVGAENWQNDQNVTHCPLCFAKFNILIRKHHCRLCGRVVTDSAFNTDDPNMTCSIQVPVGILLKKLPNLNYSPQVKENWMELTSVAADSRYSNIYSFRCCRECKNLLLHGVKSDAMINEPENDAVLSSYEEILAIKANIQSTMPRYSQLVRENKDQSNRDINKLRVRIRKYVKDFEIATNTFRLRFFKRNEESGKFTPIQSPVLVTNVYKMAIVFLQDSILEFKKLNDQFQELENARLTGQLGLPKSLLSEPDSISASPMSPLPVASPPAKPRLTKKQIREFREQLMVVNEQKFLVQKQMDDAKRQRKFDELLTLTANSDELQKHIDELEKELGEFGFA